MDRIDHAADQHQLPHNPSQHRRALLTGIGGLAAGAIITARTARAGPLDPPAGPVTSTPGPEPRTPVNSTNTPGDANSLFVITQPGSYYLPRNVAGVSGKHGIKILANHVTLDLTGFALSGVAGSLSGITTDGNFVRGLDIRNGDINSWGANGITLSGFGHALDHLRLFNNGNHGLAAVLDTHLQSCTALSNTVNGFDGGNNAKFENCRASSNGNNGFHCGDGVWADSCLASGNGNMGFDCEVNASFFRCTAKANQSVGLRCLYNAVIDSCHAMDSVQSSGISLGSACSVTNCVASNNRDQGIRSFGVSCTVSNCAVNACAYGISVGSGSVVIGSTATDCVERGITVDDGAVVEACTARGNGSSGILASSNCTVRANNSTNNGGPGISASFGNRIEANNCLNNPVGISVTGIVNIVLGNTCRANTTNFSIVASNRVGPIVVPPLSGAINGNSGAAGLGSTDPWANFAF